MEQEAPRSKTSERQSALVAIVFSHRAKSSVYFFRFAVHGKTEGWTSCPRLRHPALATACFAISRRERLQFRIFSPYRLGSFVAVSRWNARRRLGFSCRRRSPRASTSCLRKGQCPWRPPLSRCFGRRRVSADGLCPPEGAPFCRPTRRSLPLWTRLAPSRRILPNRQTQDARERACEPARVA